MRESIKERKTLMRIAPHLVHPLKCLMPTYGHALKGKEVMAVALLMNDIIGFDRNGLPDSSKFMPRGHVISRAACQQLLPGLDDDGLTGGAVWYDCQVDNSERLAFSMLHSAVDAGAVAANYLAVAGFKMDGARVAGVTLRDATTGATFAVDADLVLNTTGPWCDDLLGSLNGQAPRPQVKLSAAMNLVIGRRLFDDLAVGVFSKSQVRDEDALLDKGARLLFITPWKQYSLVGTTHIHYEGSPSDFRIRETDILAFLSELNEAYPAANLRREDVLFFYGGLLPVDSVDERTGQVNLLKNYRIVDHAQDSGLEGLLSVVSVKYTTARDVAEKAVDCACRKLGRPEKSSTAATPVYGGDIEHLADYLAAEKTRQSGFVDADTVEHLVRNYGSGYEEVLGLARENAGLLQRVSENFPVLGAEVVYAVREEMAVTLADVVRRRTELGSAGDPGDAALKGCARLMAAELGWDDPRVAEEIAATHSIYLAKS